MSRSSLNRQQVILVTMAMILAGCSTSESDGAFSEAPTDSETAEPAAGDDSSDDSSDSGNGEVEAGPDNGDAAEIIGNPDLDVDDLPDDVAETLDEIDDIVSIGECSSEAVGLAITAPDGWQCRVLDQPVGDLDGFTLFTEGNQLNITIGTPSPLGSPCEALSLCEEEAPIALSDQYPDTTILMFVGTVLIQGTHKTVDAEMVITNPTELTEEEVTFIKMVLDSTVEL